MVLMTKEIEEKLEKSPLYSKDGQGTNAECIVKYFNPYGTGTWYVTEGEKQENGDWLFFGLVDLFEREWGYFTLSELQSVKTPPFGLGIERDLHCEGKTVRDLAGADEWENEENEPETVTKYEFNGELYDEDEIDEAVRDFAEETYDDMLDDAYGEVKICGYKYPASHAFRLIDRIAYDCGLSDYEDSLRRDVKEVEVELDEDEIEEER